MDIQNYSDLLAAARAQPTPQRLLFAFAAAHLPGDASAEQRHNYERQQGGTLNPVMCVDKLIDDLSDFGQLVQESQQTGAHWDIMFISSMRADAANADAVDAALKRMLTAINQGQIEGFLAFNREGELLRLQQ